MKTRLRKVATKPFTPLAGCYADHAVSGNGATVLFWRDTETDATSLTRTVDHGDSWSPPMQLLDNATPGQASVFCSGFAHGMMYAAGLIGDVAAFWISPSGAAWQRLNFPDVPGVAMSVASSAPGCFMVACYESHWPESIEQAYTRLHYAYTTNNGLAWTVISLPKRWLLNGSYGIPKRLGLVAGAGCYYATYVETVDGPAGINKLVRIAHGDTSMPAAARAWPGASEQLLYLRAPDLIGLEHPAPDWLTPLLQPAQPKSGLYFHGMSSGTNYDPPQFRIGEDDVLLTHGFAHGGAPFLRLHDAGDVASAAMQEYALGQTYTFHLGYTGGKVIALCDTDFTAVVLEPEPLPIVELQPGDTPIDGFCVLKYTGKENMVATISAVVDGDWIDVAGVFDQPTYRYTSEQITAYGSWYQPAASVEQEVALQPSERARYLHVNWGRFAEATITLTETETFWIGLDNCERAL